MDEGQLGVELSLAWHQQSAMPTIQMHGCGYYLSQKETTSIVLILINLL